METLTFNKKLTNTRQNKGPTIIFIKIPGSGGCDRYQGCINIAGHRLIKSLLNNYVGLNVFFSDEHSFIGFTPSSKGGVKRTFGATQLFKSLRLKVGHHYTITSKYSSGSGEEPLIVIDSNEHN